MNDLDLEEGVHDSTLEFITVKEENIEDISVENYQRIKEIIRSEDKTVKNALYIKNEDLYTNKIPLSEQTKLADMDRNISDR